MSEGKHTKGPWFYNDGEKGKYFPHVVLGGDNPKSGHYITVNTCGGHNGGQMNECQANARLIASAPDLLEACEAALPWIGKMIADGAHMNSVAPNACVGAMQRMDAAIRKAEGK